MILMITDIKKADEEHILGRIEEAKEIELGGYFRWESVSLSPEEMRLQVKNFFDFVKKIRPYTNDFLKLQNERINELTSKLMNDPNYFKQESYIKEVERVLDIEEINVTRNKTVEKI